MVEDRRAFIDGLRNLADWFEAHPTVQLPIPSKLTISPPDEGKAAVAVMARLLSPCAKEMDNNLLTLVKSFPGNIQLRVLYWRDKVCKRRVTGTQEVPAQLIPAHTEEIVEWDCTPLLEDTL